MENDSAPARKAAFPLGCADVRFYAIVDTFLGSKCYSAQAWYWPLIQVVVNGRGPCYRIYVNNLDNYELF